MNKTQRQHIYCLLSGCCKTEQTLLLLLKLLYKEEYLAQECITGVNNLLAVKYVEYIFQLYQYFN